MKVLTIKKPETVKKKETDDNNTIKVRAKKNGTGLKIGTKFSYITLQSTNNCKLSIVENLTSFKNFKDEEQKKVAELLTKELEDARAFFVHVHKEENIEALKKYFNLAYCVEVPIGYYHGYQYHAVFYTDDFNYYNEIKKEGCNLCS